MTYNEAVVWRENNLDRIGKVDEKGFIVNDLFIVPATEIDKDAFFRAYLYSRDKDAALSPFIHKDVQVWAVDLVHLRESNILFYDIIAR